MRSRNLMWIMLSLTGLLCSAQEPAQLAQTGEMSQGPRSITSAALPLTFEANHGQTSAQARFISHGKGYTAFLTAGGLVLSLHPKPTAVTQPASHASTAIGTSQPRSTIQFKLLGAAQNPAVIGEGQQPGRVNYFIGNDPAKWSTNVPTYARVRYKNVYPGIDLVYYGNHRQLEYDFAVAPGADPGQIQFEILGASKIELNADSNLILQTTSGELRFQSPVIYQESRGSRVPVSGAYVIDDATHISFHLARYDSSKALVIDPVLVYSTYLGGSGDDQLSGIAVDNAGNVYLAGYTDSTDFPLATLGALPAGSPHVFVAKLDPTGSNLLYADYIGGNSQDYGYALVLDSANEVYVTGSTASSDFPLVNPYQGTYPGSFNGFLSKVSADGSSLLYSTYFGGNGSDIPSGVAIDSLSEVLVAGNTTSTNFPVANAYQSTASANQGGNYGNYGFLTKFSADGSSLVYSTYLAGNSNVAYNCGSPCWGSPFTEINGIAVDGSGNAYAVGNTNTYNFPTTSSAYLTTDSTSENAFVGFLTKFSSAGTLDYSTYFYESSGLLNDLSAVAVDSSGSAYITGEAYSDGTFPITSTSICDPGVYGSACGYAFVTKFDSRGSTLLYSTFLGPNNSASPSKIALDTNNDAYVLASSTSSSFATVNGIEPYSNGSDVLLVEIDPAASTQQLATFLGGSSDDFSSGLAVDSNGYIYISGFTDSADFPITPGAFQGTPGGGYDSFVMKIGPSAAPSVAVSPDSLQFALQALGSTSAAQTVLLRNMGSSQLTISSNTASGDFAESDNCGNILAAASSCTLSITFTPTAPLTRTGSIAIQDDAAGSPQAISLSGTGSGPGASLSPASLTFAAQLLGSASAAQTVTLTNSGNVTLNVGTIQATGDFAQTNTCGSQLASGSSCAIHITFSPKASGNRSGTLTVSDNATGSPQSVSISGTGLDFGVTVSPSSDTVKAGSTATYTLTISSIGGSFPGAVSLACGALPAGATCSFLPSVVTPGTHAATSTLSISTTASVAQDTPFGRSRTAPIYAVWIQLQGIGVFGVVLAARSRKKKLLRVLALLALVTVFLVSMIACAGGTGIAPNPQTGTTTGTYTVTVTGTAGSLQHSLPMTLTVQ